MDNACESSTDKGGETGEPDETAAAPGDPGVTDMGGIPEETDGDADADLKEEESELKSQDVSNLTTVERENSLLFTPAAKKLKIDTKEKKKMQILVSSFSFSFCFCFQLNHYEIYYHSVSPKAAIKRPIQSISGTSMSQNVVIAVFVWEVVEAALDVCQKWGEMPPLQPKHMREAVRKSKSKGQIPNSKHKKKSSSSRLKSRKAYY
uniref:TAFII28-like protein domain-containing protein n=1 Tax=Mandrillus leucophaeus TaxID=9568 RepID=A0A2K5XXE1_MANLE